MLRPAWQVQGQAATVTAADWLKNLFIVIAVLGVLVEILLLIIIGLLAQIRDKH